jgi:hypothetical protein
MRFRFSGLPTHRRPSLTEIVSDLSMSFDHLRRFSCLLMADEGATNDGRDAIVVRQRLIRGAAGTSLRALRRASSRRVTSNRSRCTACTSGISTTSSATNQTCSSLARITSPTTRSFVPSSPASAARRAIVRASFSSADRDGIMQRRTRRSSYGECAAAWPGTKSTEKARSREGTVASARKRAGRKHPSTNGSLLECSPAPCR